MREKFCKKKELENFCKFDLERAETTAKVTRRYELNSWHLYLLP